VGGWRRRWRRRRRRRRGDQGEDEDEEEELVIFFNFREYVVHNVVHCVESRGALRAHCSSLTALGAQLL
jgi:hypothetical protein